MCCSPWWGTSWNPQASDWLKHSGLLSGLVNTPLNAGAIESLIPHPQRRLKIGLVSPDFCRHAVSYFVEPLLEQWDRQKLEITLYSCGEQFDDYSLRLQAKADHWVNLHGQSDEACIAQDPAG